MGVDKAKTATVGYHQVAVVLVRCERREECEDEEKLEMRNGRVGEVGGGGKERWGGKNGKLESKGWN